MHQKNSKLGQIYNSKVLGTVPVYYYRDSQKCPYREWPRTVSTLHTYLSAPLSQAKVAQPSPVLALPVLPGGHGPGAEAVKGDDGGGQLEAAVGPLHVAALPQGDDGVALLDVVQQKKLKIYIDKK